MLQPTFFFDTADAEEITSLREVVLKKETPRLFRLCGGDEGCAPIKAPDAAFANEQHRVASETLENKTTFTRHNAFLKKATQKLL